MEEQTQSTQSNQHQESQKKGIIFPLILLIIGIIWLIQVAFDIDIWLNIPWEYIWPVAIILLAINMLWKRKG